MGKLVLDAATTAKLTATGGVVELLDPATGAVVGYYHPPVAGGNPAGGWGPFTAEEVAAAFSPVGPDEQCLTTAELLAELRKL